ncbi:transcriptional regulator LysR family [Vibrio maritimus]|uniref:Transcriptional regulator LysR family n=1 Tax=Vibrio maritimus TaxID=990268 RepID=A0A090T1B5_9VIBR|nr:transcriptional regulator LysR family [Vibrio maritimus]
MFTLDQLSAFCTAVEAGSFSGAARKTGKGLTTISTAISTLEDHLGVLLFDRSGRYPRLTANGERLYAQANVLFRQVETIVSSAEDSISCVESSLTIGLGELVPTTMVETIIEKVSQQYPNTSIEIHRATRERLLKLIVDKKIELALIASFGNPHEGIEFTGVKMMPMALACAPDSPLADVPIVSAQMLYSSRQIICKSIEDNPLLANYMIYSPINWKTTSLDDAIRLTEQGIGWSCLPEELIAEREAIGSMVRFESDIMRIKLEIPIDLVTLQGANGGEVQLFLKEFFKST